MDEQRLSELLRAAAEDAPPAGFDHADVVAASHRATARRRRIAGGVAAGVIGVVAAGGIAASVLNGVRNASDSAAAPAAPQVEAADRAEQAARPVPPAGAGLQRGVLDNALVTDVAAVLPAARNRPAAPVPNCPPGARGVEVTLPDGAVRVVVGSGESGTALPPGARSQTARTASGQSLTVSAIPTPAGPGPDQGTLARVVDALAARY